MVLIDASRTKQHRGRGAVSNHTGRFEPLARLLDQPTDAWHEMDQAPRTRLHLEQAKSIISTNDSPDLSFDQSINPYRGCEHGCVYCYARPTHAFLGHSPGLDFETEIYAKINAAALLERALDKPGYTPKAFALGAVTDPYQPVERTQGITRQILGVLERTRHPVGIVTKSAGILRDIECLSRMARHGLVKVALSMTTLDPHVARVMEPRAATPQRRLETIKALSDAGVPVSVLTAPIIPALNDHEIEAILAAAARHGARDAGYVLLRLPHELKTIFREWLATHFPDRAKRIISILQSMHGGRDYNPAFGARQKGSGPYADMIAQRIRQSLARNGLNQRGRLLLRTDLFRPPRSALQLDLL